jgi:hypothetical protein
MRGVLLAAAALVALIDPAAARCTYREAFNTMSGQFEPAPIRCAPKSLEKNRSESSGPDAPLCLFAREWRGHIERRSGTRACA